MHASSSFQCGEDKPQRPASQEADWHELIPAAVLLVVGLATFVVVGLGPVAGRDQYAVVAPPWYGIEQTAALVLAAGADIVDAGGLGNVLIVRGSGADFSRSLYRNGAWLVLDPVHLRGCLGFGGANISRTVTAAGVSS
jgi:hypothetical protein